MYLLFIHGNLPTAQQNLCESSAIERKCILKRYRLLNVINKVKYPGFSQEHSRVFGDGKEQRWLGRGGVEGEGMRNMEKKISNCFNAD